MLLTHLQDRGRTALYFALGEDMVECRLVGKDETPVAGSVVTLRRGANHPDAKRGEPVDYCVVATKSVGGGWAGLDTVTEERNWLEAQECAARDRSDFFDAYTMAYYLGLPLNEDPVDSVIVEVVAV